MFKEEFLALFVLVAEVSEEAIATLIKTNQAIIHPKTDFIIADSHLQMELSIFENS